MRHHAAYSGAAGAVSLLLTSLCTPAEAASPPGPYLGVGAGAYTLDIHDLDTGDFQSDSGHYGDAAAMVRGFGGLRLGPYWAVEADYQRLAQSQDSIRNVNVDVDLHAWTVSVRPILPLGEQSRPLRPRRLELVRRQGRRLGRRLPRVTGRQR